MIFLHFLPHPICCTGQMLIRNWLLTRAVVFRRDGLVWFEKQPPLGILITIHFPTLMCILYIQFIVASYDCLSFFCQLHLDASYFQLKPSLVVLRKVLYLTQATGEFSANSICLYYTHIISMYSSMSFPQLSTFI